MFLRSRLLSLGLAVALSLGGSFVPRGTDVSAANDNTPERIAREQGASPQAIATAEAVRNSGHVRQTRERFSHQEAALKTPPLAPPSFFKRLDVADAQHIPQPGESTTFSGRAPPSLFS